MNSLLCFFLAVLLFCCAPCFPQEVGSGSYSLSEALDLALERNLELSNAGLGVAMAGHAKWEAISRGLPQIDGFSEYRNRPLRPVTLVPSELAGGGVGGFVPLVFATRQQLDARVSLTQLLFDGSYLVGVRAARAFDRYSADVRERTALEVRREVVERYAGLLLSRENLRLLGGNLAELERDLFEAGQVLANGLSEAETVEQLRITVNTARMRLSRAQLMDTLSLRLLNHSLGNPLDAPFTPEDSLGELTAYCLQKGLVDTLGGIRSNLDYRIAEDLRERRYYEHRLARSRGFPVLSGFVDYGTSAFGDGGGFLGRGQEWFGSSSLGLSLRVPLFSSFGRRASVRRAALELERAETSLRDTERDLEIALERALGEYRLAVSALSDQREALALAGTIAQKNRTKFFEGMGSSFDLRAAQLQLYRSQGDYLRAMEAVIDTLVELSVLLNRELTFDMGELSPGEVALTSAPLGAPAGPVPVSGAPSAVGDPVPPPRKVAGAASGYYLVANVFSEARNVSAFEAFLEGEGLSAGSLYDPARKLYYVYLGRYEDRSAAKKTARDGYGGRYGKALWVLAVE